MVYFEVSVTSTLEPHQCENAKTKEPITGKRVTPEVKAIENVTYSAECTVNIYMYKMGAYCTFLIWFKYMYAFVHYVK